MTAKDKNTKRFPHKHWYTQGDKIWFSLFYLSTEAVIPEYFPVFHAVDRNDAIQEYFTLGFSASEILSFLFNVHGIQLSLRQLKRVLKSRGCMRRGQSTDLNTIVQAVEEELRRVGGREPGRIGGGRGTGDGRVKGGRRE